MRTSVSLADVSGPVETASFSMLMSSRMTVLRDVRCRGRDIEGCTKQWFSFVKPNFHKYVNPQREKAGER